MLSFRPFDGAQDKLKPESRRFRHPGENRGPAPMSWIPFSNGMTDAVRHLDAGVRRHDELSLFSDKIDFSPSRDRH